VTAHTFEKARDWAQRGGFDVAIIDLGWYTDDYFMSRHSRIEARTLAGILMIWL
jgi:hypothetical protein